MKKLFFLVITLCFVWTASALFHQDYAHAVSFTFGPLSDQGGTGTAIMDISIVDTTLTAKLYNTSPVTLDDGTGSNAPGIVGFGFDLDPESPTLQLISWSLTAYDSVGALKTIGDSSGTITEVGSWSMLEDDNFDGIKVDFTTHVKDIKGALYNPDVTGGLAASPNYYTEAILVMDFNMVPLLNTYDQFSPFVRMQNVGNDGSLKLPGTSVPESPGTPVPEPATMLLLGVGLIGLTGFGRKFKKQ